MRRIPDGWNPSPSTSALGRRRWWGRHATGTLAIALAGAIGLTMVGCSSDGSEIPSATLPTTTPGATTDPEPTTTTTPPTVEEQIEAAYLEAQAAYFHAASEPEADHPLLEDTTTGLSLERSLEILERLRRDGLRVAFVGDEPPVPVVRSVEIKEASRALVTACLVDDTPQVRVADGTTAVDEVVSRLDRADMRREGDVWKLYALDAVQRWPDGMGCDR